MPLFAGPLLGPREAPPGYVRVEEGRIVEAGLGDPPQTPDVDGWICPPPVNAHTHCADTFLRGRPKPSTVAQLVGPGGWKHRQLAAARPADLEAGARQLAEEAAAVGTSHFIDFREGGLPGVELLRGIADGLPVKPVIMGRGGGTQFDAEEARRVLGVADGVGLSGIADLPAATLDGWADACRAARKPLGLHVSEARREDMEAVVALEPTFVVHAVHASRNDLELLAQEGIAVIVCPRGNRALGLRPPVDRMLEAGCMVAVGTDNGMLSDGNVLAELGQLQAWFPALGTQELLRMATHNGRSLLGLPAPLPRPGRPADLVVLPPRPFAAASSGKPAMAPAPAPEGRPDAARAANGRRTEGAGEQA